MGAGFALLPVIVGLTLVAYLVEAIVVPWKLGKVSDVKELRAYLDNGLARIPPPRGDITVRRLPAAGTGQRRAAHQDGHRGRAAGDGARISLLPAVLRRPAAPDRQPRAGQHHVRHRPRRQRRAGRPGRPRPVRDVPCSTGTRTSPRAARSRPSGTSRSPTARARGPTGSSRPRSCAPSAPGGSARWTGPARRASSRATSGRSARRRGSIYLENQYFTDAIIADALARAVTENTNLELVFLLNIKPDVLFYPGRQARLVKQVRDAAPDRVGVFTRWSYDHTRPRPWVAPDLPALQDGGRRRRLGHHRLGQPRRALPRPQPAAQPAHLRRDHRRRAERHDGRGHAGSQRDGARRAAPPTAVGRAPRHPGQRRAARPGGRPAGGHEPEAVGADLEAGGRGLAHAI